MSTTPDTVRIDATNLSLGRLAVRIAILLMGKHRVGVRAHLVSSPSIVVRNCEKIRFDKKKLKQKLYYRTSMYPGALKTTTLGDVWSKDPADALRRTVKGMLPKNSLQARRMKFLVIEAQKR